MKFHINSNGEAGRCKAEKGGCPFGGESEHFTSAEAAREHYEAQMNTPAPTISKSKKAAPSLPVNQTFEEPEYFDFKKEEDRILEGQKGSSPNSDKTEFRKAWDALHDSRYKAKNLTEKRVASALNAGYAGPLKDAISSGVIKSSSEQKRLTDNEQYAVRSISDLPVKYQEKFYALPVRYLTTLTSGKPDSVIAPANMKKLLDIATSVHAKNPEFEPERTHVTPRAQRSEYNEAGAFPIPQMQNTAPETYSLLNEYANQKYGNRKDEFWLTVKSETVNHPKISDFARAEKEFDKKLAS